MITGEKSLVRPRECRGGILADEMGMGKSLSLIALIMHTQGIVRSSGSFGKQRADQGKPRSLSPTIIITPKSSKADSGSFNRLFDITNVSLQLYTAGSLNLKGA